MKLTFGTADNLDDLVGSIREILDRYTMAVLHSAHHDTLKELATADLLTLFNLRAADLHDLSTGGGE